jgi:hypothetical protein
MTDDRGQTTEIFKDRITANRRTAACDELSRVEYPTAEFGRVVSLAQSFL